MWGEYVLNPSIVTTAAATSIWRPFSRWTWVSWCLLGSSACARSEPLRINDTRSFYRPDDLPATLPSVSNHRRHSTNPNHWHCFILSSSTTGLQMEGVVLSLCWLSPSVVTMKNRCSMWDNRSESAKGRTIQPKLDRTDPNWRFSTDQILTVTFNGPSENIYTLANESVKRCTNSVVHATPLSVADIGCFRLSVNNVRVRPVQFIRHRTTTWSASHRAHDASALLIDALRGTKQ